MILHRQAYLEGYLHKQAVDRLDREINKQTKRLLNSVEVLGTGLTAGTVGGVSSLVYDKLKGQDTNYRRALLLSLVSGVAGLGIGGYNAYNNKDIQNK